MLQPTRLKNHTSWTKHVRHTVIISTAELFVKAHCFFLVLGNINYSIMSLKKHRKRYYSQNYSVYYFTGIAMFKIQVIRCQPGDRALLNIKKLPIHTCKLFSHCMAKQRTNALLENFTYYIFLQFDVCMVICNIILKLRWVKMQHFAKIKKYIFLSNW